MLTGIIIASSLLYVAGWLWTGRAIYRSSDNRYRDPNATALGAALAAFLWPLWLVLGLLIVIVKSI